MTTNTAPATARPSRALNITLWTVQGVLAAFFAFVSVPKILGDPAVTESMAQAGFANWVGYFIGACELAGAIGLLIPRLTALAATGLTALMLCATVSNVFNMGPGAAIMTLVLAGVFATIVWARRESLKKLINR